MKWDHMNSTIQISSAVRPHLLAEEFHPIPKTLQLFLIILGGGGTGGVTTCACKNLTHILIVGTTNQGTSSLLPLLMPFVQIAQSF